MEAVDATVLTVLGSAFGVMFATIVTLMVGSMRAQHRDSIETRGLITHAGNQNRDLIDEARKENRDLIEEARNQNRDLIDEARKENRDLIDEARNQNRDLVEEHKRVTTRNHDKVIGSLSDARERLARIEGHLGVGTSRRNDPEPGAGSSEAA